MEKPSNLFRFCSVVMALMFAYSASVQLNDPDWYFWFPLYSLACAVNLLNCKIYVNNNTRARQIGRSALWLGVMLFVKVVIEDLMSQKDGLFLSLDLSERVVREKTGSWLVVMSMILQLEACTKRNMVSRYVDYGMTSLVAFSYGLPFVFFVLQKKELKL